MESKAYRCMNCGHEFEVKIMRREEAEEKRMQLQPVTCPRCKRQNVQKLN